MRYARAWVIVTLTATGLTMMHFHRLVPTVIADHLALDFGLTATGVGFFASAFFYSYALLQVLAGRVIDQFGPRLAVLWGLAIVAVTTSTTGWAESFTLAVLSRVLAGAGASVFFSAIVSRIAQLFPAPMFASVHGVMFTYQNLAGMFMLVPMAAITNSWGWRPLFWSAALIAVAIALAVALVKDPARLEIPTEGLAQQPLPPLWSALREIVSNPQTWPPFLVFLGAYSPYLAFSGFWGIPWLMEIHGLTRSGATAVLLAFAAGALFSPPLLGWASGYLNSYRTPMLWGMLLCCGAWAVLTAGMWLKWPLATLMPVIVILGGASVAFNPTYAVIKELHPPHLLGIATGLQNTAGFIGGMLLQPGLGWVIDFFSHVDPITQLRLPTSMAYVAAAGVSTLVAGIGLAAALAIPHRLQRGVSSPN